MKAGFVAVATLLFGIPAGVVFGQSDPEDPRGSKDYSLFSRFPGYRIDSYKYSKFNSHTYKLKNREEIVEGACYTINYCAKRGTQEASELEVIRNYENAIRNAAGTVLYTAGTNYTVGRIAKDAKEIWVRVHPWNGGSCLEMNIVERKPMEQSIQATADAWLADISTSGHAAVYGIYFDTDKADLRAESGPALKEMTKMLNSDPKMAVFIVGHTDSSGEYLHNMKLSEARANAVIAALVTKYGIAAGRLKALGVGPVAPVASNRAEEGRAKNRRVELVER